MLLEFRLCNYRSFGEESAFSLVASGDREHADTNLAETGVSALPRALRSSVVYGANASGKSNLLRAMLFMRNVVLGSFSLQPTQKLNVQPFLLDEKLKGEPTLFEVTVVLGGVRYQYGFKLTPDRIVAEWLYVYQKSKAQRWLDRSYDAKTDKDIYDNTSFLLGQKKAWQDATRPNALFLSTAVQLNSEQLAPLHRWFAEYLVVFLDGGHIPYDFTTKMVQEAEGERAIRAVMGSADLAIASIAAEKRKGFQGIVQFDLATGQANSKREEGELLFPTFEHRAGNTSARFEYVDESQGTQKLFSLAGPILDILKHGKVLVIDELDRSLHPLLVRQIVSTFHDPEQNRRGAQLIFTTHDTSLLDSHVLRRDQIWLAEKQENQSSKMVPLSEFSPRKGEALEKGYLSGRYGGVPILPERLNTGRPRVSR
jgi:AAA15 family ATPase/GTPase